MSKSKKTLIVSVVLAALVAFAGSVLAFAQVADQDSENGPDPEQTGVFDPARQGLANQGRSFDRLPRRWPGAGEIDYDALLADALDSTIEELMDAHEEAKSAALEQAVEEGYITQRQVDLMTTVWIMRGAIDRGELVAGALGISVDELREARQDRALRELLAELDVTPVEVKEAVLAEFEEVVAQAVEDGLISEEQAELIQDRPAVILQVPRDRQH